MYVCVYIYISICNIHILNLRLFDSGIFRVFYFGQRFLALPVFSLVVPYFF